MFVGMRSIIFSVGETVGDSAEIMIASFRTADRAGIHEIRGPPHWCKVSIVVTQLDVQCSAYRIADHWFEVDTLFLAACTSACVSIPISIYFLERTPQKGISSLAFVARNALFVQYCGANYFFRHFLPNEDPFERTVKSTLKMNLILTEKDGLYLISTFNVFVETQS